MRPVILADVLGLARALGPVPEAGRPGLAARLIEEARLADNYRRQFGVSHPLWGDGSVLSRCLLTQNLPEGGADSLSHLTAIAQSALALCNALSGQHC